MEGLKALIRQRLHSSPIVAQVLEERPDLKGDPASLLSHLEEKGLVEDIFESLELELSRQQPEQIVEKNQVKVACSRPSPPIVDSSCEALLAGASPWSLVLRVNEGRAFLDFLDNADAEGRELCWYVSFGRQRVRCHPVPASVDPRFDETLIFGLPAVGSRAALLTHSVPIHLVLVSRSIAGHTEDPWDDGACNLLCSYTFEWRHSLAAAGPQKVTLELPGVGRRRQISVGVLHGEIEVRPAGTAGVVPESAIASQILAEQQRREDLMRQVFEGLDRWWASYHELYKSRNVRLFAQTEGSLFLPVTSFISPLEVGRSLDSPLHALRWVSLIGTLPATPTGAGSESSSIEPRWHTFPALWARGRASLEEKAILLTSLLLGYSLDAWCCFGLDSSNLPHAWVIVRSRGDVSTPAQVTCWDPRFGVRMAADDSRYLSTYSSFDMIFNDRALYICHTGSVAHVAFDFRDVRRWLPVPLDPGIVQSPDGLRLYDGRLCAPFADLRPRTWGLPLDTETMEETIEQRLMSTVRSQREANGLATRVDEHLCQLLQIALANCELDRTMGTTQGSIFEDIVQRICAPEDIFQAVPVQFNHLKVSHFWPVLSERPTVRTLLGAPAASTSFALRARIIPYPEGVVAVWILFAAMGRP